ncbi:MAG TPA: hypothetical protein VGD45_07060 [Steroidobacter sp.]|uniref:hypothetical protein n=1 Tax=Steroidobacter sp. TaxID=1978227 RepID=UPI002ED8DFEA
MSGAGQSNGPDFSKVASLIGESEATELSNHLAFSKEWIEPSGNIRRWLTTVEGSQLKAVPVIWGGQEFTRLHESFKKHVRCARVDFVEPTERYDLFQWADELQPTLGIFPLYLFGDRRAAWRVIPLGKQRRVAIVMSAGMAQALADLNWRPQPRPANNPYVTGKEFGKLIAEIARSATWRKTQFIHFGLGHAAPKILARTIEDPKACTTFLQTLDYCRSLPKVKVARARAVMQMLGNRKPDDNHVIHTQAFRDGLQRAQARGVLDELIERQRGEFVCVVSDLGVAEFLQLQELATGLSPPLEIWDIEHGLDIPLGIGLSIPALMWLNHHEATAERIGHAIKEWFLNIEERRDEIEARYGIALENPGGDSLAADAEFDHHDQWLTKHASPFHQPGKEHIFIVCKTWLKRKKLTVAKSALLRKKQQEYQKACEDGTGDFAERCERLSAEIRDLLEPDDAGHDEADGGDTAS